MRGLGYQVPHGAAVAVTNGPFSSTSSCDGVDQVDGVRVVAVFHNVFIVVEPGQELDFGWLVNPGAGNAGVDVSGYLLPFP